MPNIGWGGGRAPSFDANNRYNLAKPYDMEGEMTPEKMANLNEMLQELYMAQQLSLNTLLNSDGESEGGEEEFLGDVVGPSSSTDDNIPMFDGTTGKLIADSGISKSALIAADSNGTVFKSITDITAAQFATIRATPVSILSAPGTDKILLWLATYASENVDSVWSATVTLDIHFTGITSAVLGTIASVVATGVTGLRFTQTVGGTGNMNSNDFKNTGISVRKSTAGESTGGSFVNDRLRIVTFYSIMDAPY